MFLTKLDLTFKAYCLSKEKINGCSPKLHVVLKLNWSMQCDFIGTLKNGIKKVWNLKQFLGYNCHFWAFENLVHSGVLWWTLHRWHDLWIFSWLHIISWHSIICQELVSSYTLFQFRDTLKCHPCERSEIFCTFCPLVEIFYSCFTYNLFWKRISLFSSSHSPWFFASVFKFHGY
jgi:hypothetical protein